MRPHSGPFLRLLAPLLVAAAALASAGVVWHFSWAAALGQVAARGQADLDQSSDRLIARLHGYRELAVFLADHPAIRALPETAGAADAQQVAEVAALLRAMADKTGALGLFAFDGEGRLVAGSDPLDPSRAKALWAPALDQALTGALGRFAGADPRAGRRSFGYAAPVHGIAQAAPTGALLIAADLERIEAEWRGDPSAVFFSGPDGRVLISNRSELVLSLPGSVDGAFPKVQAMRRGGSDLWRIADGGRYLPQMAVHIARDLPVIGMRGDVLVDAAPAWRVAMLQAGLAGMVCLLGGGALLWTLSWRSDLARRLAAEAAAKEVLEQRVAERTRELSETNRALRHEVAERREAEALLKATQDRLVQAGKLSALGEMSAGISHELNQPLMAIQSFAENGQLLLEQGRGEVVAQNLARIAELGRRMGRIIRNLRAFARQENAPVRPVDPVAVVETVLELLESRLRRDGVTVDWAPPQGRWRVMAGEVRLQQVVMNLLTNALDAMEHCPAPRLEISLAPAERHLSILVADSGPGIANPDRIFDPFYTTKAVDQGEGMGLGLSISYGLVQSFGGAIEGRNRAAGGAVFTVTLPRGEEEMAA